MTNSNLKDEELYQQLQHHDHFFHRCVQMIPHELYKHTESMTGFHDDTDDEDEQNEEKEANNKYYKHRKQPLTADERKLKSVENKKRKYSSENAKSETAPEDEDDEDENESIEQAETDKSEEPFHKKQKLISGAAVAGTGDKLDELRKKLQERITSLKQQRETKKPHKLQKQQQLKQQQEASKNKDKKNPPTQKKPSSKKPNEDNSANGRSVEALENTIDRLRSELLSNDRDVESKTASSSSANQDFEFNQINEASTTSADYQKAGIPNAGGTKKQRLQRLLQEAEKKRQRYQQLASSENPIEKQKLQSEQWNDVLASAAGKKTILVSGNGTTIGGSNNNDHMVSKSEIKIKKALKKLEKKKEKSAKEWKDRLDTLDNEKQEKLAKREENIQKHKKHNDITTSTTTTESSSNNHNHHHKNKPSVKISRPGQSNQNNNHHKDNHNGGGSHQSHGQKKPNRAGFEGKKSDGKFLNAK